MRRHSYSPGSSSYGSSFSFGPGPLSTAIKWLIYANVAVFVVELVARSVVDAFGLVPQAVLTRLQLWRIASYMFLHAGPIHLLFNMLALWMFGTELERIWGTRQFLRFYFVTGMGAALLTIVFSLLPIASARDLYTITVIGASGAVYGLLLAYALYFPDRPILLYFVFPIPAKYFVIIIGLLAFYSSMGETSGVASATHLGGLVVAYVYLKKGRVHPLSELKYRYLKWKVGRTRRKFDLYSGGRADDWNRRIH